MASVLRLRCSYCGHCWERPISDRDAVFAETRASQVAQSGRCQSCGSDKFDWWGHSHPLLPRDFLVEWSRDESLNLGPVEEDVLLEIHGRLDDLIWLLDRPDILVRKSWDVVAALCNLLLISLDEQSNEALSEAERSEHAAVIIQIRSVLTKHRALALEAHLAEDYCLGGDFDEFILPILDGSP